MGVLADQLTELIERMKESDRRHQAALDEFLESTRKSLDELKKLDQGLSDT